MAAGLNRKSFWHQNDLIFMNFPAKRLKWKPDRKMR